MYHESCLHFLLIVPKLSYTITGGAPSPAAGCLYRSVLPSREYERVPLNYDREVQIWLPTPQPLP